MTTAKGRKAPPVTVRRPPELPSVDPPDPSAAAAFVGGNPGEASDAPVHQTTGASVHQTTDAPVHQTTGAPVRQSAEMTTLEAPPTGALAVAPTTDVQAAARERTDASEISGISAPKHRSTSRSGHQAPKAPKGPAKGRGLVERADGKTRRRVVVYMDPVIARQLSIRALDDGTDVSALVNAAVRLMLAQ